MKLRDWYNFNFGNEQFRCNFGDIYVKVFRKESPKSDDVIFTQLMSPEDMIYLFGDYKVFIVGKHEENAYWTMKVCICKAD
jgi:hypothetical protein